MFYFQVCCRGQLCQHYGTWFASPILNKSGLTITVSVNSSCVGQQVVGLRYLWRTTPCPFKQAALYSTTDPNLPSPPYFKYLLNSEH
jgi:sialate O-acetylesterase